MLHLLLLIVANAQKLFEPNPVGCEAWPKSGTRLGVEAQFYNPRAALLPGFYREALAYKLGRNATYLVALRRGTCDGSKGGPPVVALFDNRMQYIVETRPVFESKHLMELTSDVDEIHLETKGDKILAHGPKIMWRRKAQRYVFWWIKLEVDEAEPMTLYSSLTDVDMFETGAIGVIWNGDPAKPLNVLQWLGQNMTIHELGRNRRIERQGLLGNGLAPPFDRSIKTAGSPATLDPQCPGLMAAFGQSRIDDASIVSNIVIFKNEPPYSAIAVSPPFCIPTIDDEHDLKPADRCELVQTVGSFFLVQPWLLLITYGIDECEAAYVTVGLKTMLDFISPSLATTYCPPSYTVLNDY